MKNALLILILLLAASAATAQAPIVGGNYVKHGDYPFIVSLEVQGSPICGAALIAPEWVLTAGHCGAGFPPFIPQPDRVVINLFSRMNPNADAETIMIDTIFIHRSFDIMNFIGPDIALIKLKQPSTKIPIAIASATDAHLYNANSKCKVIGWGSTDIQGTQSDTLREANVQIINFDTCKTSYAASNWFLENYQVCVGYLKDSSEAGAGAGDSGGPLFAWQNNQWVHIGIVSGGNEMITTIDYPGIFTRTGEMRNWIDSVMAANTIFAGTPTVAAGDFNLIVKAEEIEITLEDLNQDLEIHISNLLGQQITSMIATGGIAIVTVDNLIPGIYVATVRTEKGISSKKFYKQ